MSVMLEDSSYVQFHEEWSNIGQLFWSTTTFFILSAVSLLILGLDGFGLHPTMTTSTYCPAFITFVFCWVYIASMNFQVVGWYAGISFLNSWCHPSTEFLVAFRPYLETQCTSDHCVVHLFYQASCLQYSWWGLQFYLLYRWWRLIPWHHQRKQPRPDFECLKSSPLEICFWFRNLIRHWHNPNNIDVHWTIIN